MLGLASRRKRLKAVLGRVAHDVVRAGQSGEGRREAIQAQLREVHRKHSRKGFDLRTALSQAGLQISPRRFIAWSFTCGVTASLVGLAISPFIAVCLGLIGGLGAPRAALVILIRRRLASFIGSFAEALDIVIRSVRSGLPLGESLHIIGREMPDPIGLEFRVVMEGVRLGMTMEESLQSLAKRVPAPEVRFFAIVVGIQQQTGGNLAETLNKLSEVLRARKRMRDKVQALASEAKTSAIIIGSLPLVVAGLLAFLSPDYIALLFTTSPGHLILFVSGLMMLTGAFVMRSMINFEF